MGSKTVSTTKKGGTMLRFIFACCFTMSIFIGTAAAREPKETRELSRLVRQFVNATTRALRQDEHVKKHDEQQQLAIQALERRPLEPLNRNLCT
jgi:hypothetical protein